MKLFKLALGGGGLSMMFIQYDIEMNLKIYNIICLIAGKKFLGQMADVIKWLATADVGIAHNLLCRK